VFFLDLYFPHTHNYTCTRTLNLYCITKTALHRIQPGLQQCISVFNIFSALVWDQNECKYPTTVLAVIIKKDLLNLLTSYILRLSISFLPFIQRK